VKVVLVVVAAWLALNALVAVGAVALALLAPDRAEPERDW
jgi:hypothetical protein